MIGSKPGRGRIGALLALGAAIAALLALPAGAAARDRNHDHIPDRWEKRHHLSLKVNQARRDQDHDGLDNRAEFLAGDNPRNPDSNGDGVSDGEENAGTIASFDRETGRLVIQLFGGESIAGLVTAETEIRCEGGGASASSDGSQGDRQGGDGGEAGEEGQAGEEEPASGELAGGDDGAAEEQSGDEEAGMEEEAGEEDGEAGEAGGACTTADLAPGAVVAEAELRAGSGEATFEKVELSGREG